MTACTVLVGDPRFNPEGDKEHESAPILKVRTQSMGRGNGTGC